MTAGVSDSRPAAVGAFAEAFRGDGFGIVRGALAASEAERMRRLLVQMLASVRQSATAPLEARLPRLVEQHPEFAALAAPPPLLGLLDELFGTTPLLVNSHGHVKPAGTGAHTSVHSDVAHLRGVPHHESTLMVKAMYALTTVGPGSGATLVYPGTHRQRTAERVAPQKGGVRLLLEPGDLVLFHANLLHTATANPSRSHRLSVWFFYAQPWMRVFPGHEYTSAFLDALGPMLDASPEAAPVFGLSNPYSTGQ